MKKQWGEDYSDIWWEDYWKWLEKLIISEN